MTLRAVFLTHYFPPEVGAPQTRIAALAEGLCARGLEVTVHTGFPNYPSGRILAPYRNRLLRRERTAGGVRVVRSAIYPTPNRGFARRLINHPSFALSALGTVRASGSADVIVAETPPLFVAGAAVIYARIKRARLILNVSDLWPDSAVALGALESPRAIRAARRLEQWSYRHAAAVTVPTPGMVRLLDALPAARGRAVHMPPAVDVERFESLPPPDQERPLRVLYAGTLGLAQGLETLVAAARIAGPDVVRVTIAGDGADGRALHALLADGRISNVELLGSVPASSIPGLYSRAHAGVVLLRDRELFRDALPTKLLECLAAGRPAVVAARGDAAALVEASGAGIAVEPEDPDALAAAFRRLADGSDRARLGAAGRAAMHGSFSRDGSVARWADLIERVAAQRARA